MLTSQLWSKSKNNILDYCRKKYFYTYLHQQDSQQFYGDNDEVTVLKKLQNRFLIRGRVISNTIKMILLDRIYGFENNENYYSAIAIKELAEIINKSNDLFEKYYNLQKGIDFIKFYYETGVCIENFMRSDIFNTLKKIPPQLLKFPESENSNSAVLSFLLYDYKIFGAPDLYFADEKKLSIYNWKNGVYDKNGDYWITAALSYLYLKDLLSFEFEKFKNIYINIFFTCENKTVLYEEKNSIKKITEDFTKYLKTSIVELAKVDSKPQQWFIRTEDKNKCKLCNFKKICLT